MAEEKYCALYIRVSTDDQEVSVGHQIDILKEFIKQKKLGSVSESLIYEDIGVSGYTGSIFDRPQMTRLRKDAEKGLFQTVVFKGISRFARDTQEALDVLHRFESADLRVLSFEESFDSLDVNSKFLFTMHAALAEQESAKTAIRVRMAMKQKAKNGEWNTTPPYGYKVKHGRLIPHPDEADIVKIIFEMYVSGFYGLYRITRYLNVKGIPARSQHLWNQSSVNNILNNQAYLGRVVYNKSRKVQYRDYSNGLNGVKKWKRIINDKKDWVIVDDCHPPLITQDIFDQASNLLRERGRIVKKSTRPRYVKHLLSGLLRCHKCGTGYVVHQRKDRKTKRIYICAIKNQRGKSFCDTDRIPADELENYVLSLVRAKLHSVVSREELEARISGVNTPVGELQKKLNQIEKDLSKLSEDNADLFFRRNDMTQDQYGFIQNKIKSETDKLLQNQMVIEKQLGTIKTDSHIIDSIWEKAKELIALKEKDVEILRPILETFVERIHILPNNKVEIQYKFRF